MRRVFQRQFTENLFHDKISQQTPRWFAEKSCRQKAPFQRIKTVNEWLLSGDKSSRCLSVYLRADLVGTNIRVTNVEPGQVETQFSTVRFKGDEARAKSVYAGTQSLQAEDVAETVFWAATLPAHVNINRVEMMPTGQSFAGLSIERQS